MAERILKLLLEADTNPWVTSILVFFGSSVTGLATLLRDGKRLGGRNIISAMLNAGLFGTISFLVAWQSYKQNLPGLVGISLLAGIGTASLLSFVITLVKTKLRAILAVLFGVDPSILEKESPRE